ncbi:MFS transporter [Brevibacterium marinum]|uniref:MFS family permease n=1 Tax=Brevibacterium marinum TaxID=418643 RepID=A0A846S6C9_9MICO|nr:MFS transporter [Brevibacterium marinum]NJC57002.1 MFS family permease [Brevibacterium marinum]
MTSGEHGYDYSYNFVLIGTLIAAAVELVLVPVFGMYSDTIGRKKVYAWGAAVMGVWGFIYFALLDSGVTWLAFVALCLGLIPHAMHYGP